MLFSVGSTSGMRTSQVTWRRRQWSTAEVTCLQFKIKLKARTETNLFLRKFRPQWLNKSLICKYKEVKGHNSKSSNGRITFPFYQQMDSILGDKPSVTPSNVLDSFLEAEPVDWGHTAIPTCSTRKKRKNKMESTMELFVQRIGSTLTQTDDKMQAAQHAHELCMMNMFTQFFASRPPVQRSFPDQALF